MPQLRDTLKPVLSEVTVMRRVDWRRNTAPARLRAASAFSGRAMSHAELPINHKRGLQAPSVDESLDKTPPTPALAKNDFCIMEALGQFNLGFIVCRLGERLFLVDQHAADEKFRYEALWRETRFETQPLLAPLALDLGAAEELTLLEHRSAVERHGFRIAIDERAPPGHRASLVAVPTMRGVTFGPPDVRELVTFVSELRHESMPEGRCSDTALPRLPKLHALFASKACRTAVMIGTPLVKTKMAQLLDHLAALVQPWNCPHGRPTTRHLAHVPHLLGGHLAKSLS